VVTAAVNQEPFAIREAVASDVPEIVSLINRAFEVERFFKSADRTDSEQVQEMMGDGKFLLLAGGGGLAACIFLKITGQRAYLGTLAVDPRQQKCGLGRHMMRAAEDSARTAGCTTLDIRIVNLRTELPPIYRKFGFVETGTQSAASIAHATRPVYFITMSKAL
jgi:ribosomal protein S18 acetylase RimI-like enzyme